MIAPTSKTVNLATVLRSGRHYGVFIDDTGSPGLLTPGLHAQRKSWVIGNFMLDHPEVTREYAEEIYKKAEGV